MLNGLAKKLAGLLLGGRVINGCTAFPFLSTKSLTRALLSALDAELFPGSTNK